MGEAMLASVLERGLGSASDICVSDTIPGRRENLKKQYNVAVTESNKEAVIDKDIVVLAVKPQNMAEVLADLKGRIQPEQLIMSIAAGVKIDTLRKGLGHECIVRVMPNTPAQIGLGMSGWAATVGVNGEQKEQVRAILGAMGKEIYFDDEKYLDMVTAVSASGPAYIFLMAEAMINAATTIGLSADEAEEMVLQTIQGAAGLMQKSDKPPAQLRQDVTSRGGTTERALHVFQEGQFNDLVRKAIEAAYRRAIELGN